MSDAESHIDTPEVAEAVSASAESPCVGPDLAAVAADATHEAAAAANDATTIDDLRALIYGRGKNSPEKIYHLKTREVRNIADFKEAVKLLKMIFTDARDLVSDQELAAIFQDPGRGRYYLICDEDRPVGVELIQSNPKSNAMYVPYAGLLPEYRNKSIYPQAAEIHYEQMRATGKDHVLYEFEDPGRIVQQGVYPGENPADVVKRCEGRINFWRRAVGCVAIDDSDVPYCRPASDNPGEIQDYDVLAFRLLNAYDVKWVHAFNSDRTAISREMYEKLYLETMQLEYGMLSKAELRSKYPAIEKFFSRLESHPEKKWITLYKQPIRPKEEPLGGIVTAGQAGADLRAGSSQRMPKAA